MKELQTIKPFINSKSSIPALAGAIVRNGWLTGYDLTAALSIKVDLPDMTIPPKAIDILVVNDNTELIYKDDELTIKFNKAKSKFKSFPLEEYPQLPDISGDVGTTLDADELNEVLASISYATSKNDLKPVHTGVRVYNGEAIAVDGVRLATRQLNADIDIIIPPQAINGLKAFTGLVNVHKTNSHLVFSSDNIRLIVRSISGEFIDHKKIIPQRDNFFKVDKSKLIEALKNIVLLQDVKVKTPCEIDIKNGVMNLKINNALSEYSHDIEVETDIKIKLGVNAVYFLEALKNLDSVELSFGNPTEPMLLKGNGLALILPIRLKER